MEKVRYGDILPFKELICSKDSCCIYRLNNDDVFKKFDIGYLVSMCDCDYDIEDRILSTSDLVTDSSIIVPNSCVYSNYNFIGYTMPFIDGLPILDYVNDNMSLNELTDLYFKVEDVVRRNPDIVFPDLLSYGNIMVDNSHDVKFIDFDGLQVMNYDTPVLSSGLGNRDIYDHTKYKSDSFYTKQLDIKSLFYLYFSIVFAYPMEDFDCYMSVSSRKEYLSKLFKFLGIDDYELFDKVCKLYSSDDNEYLGDTAYKICELYDLDVINDGHSYIKRLVRK